jgi:hypothetical protein
LEESVFVAELQHISFLFAWGFNFELFIIAMIGGVLARAEEIIILFRLKAMRSDVRGLYWVLKEGKRKLNK